MSGVNDDCFIHYYIQQQNASIAYLETSWPFLNMRSCLYLCSCGLVKRHQSSPKYCSNSKFTSSQIQLKSPDVSLLRPFYQGCIRGDLCELEAARYPRMHFAPISER